MKARTRIGGVATRLILGLILIVALAVGVFLYQLTVSRSLSALLADSAALVQDLLDVKDVTNHVVDVYAVVVSGVIGTSFREARERFNGIETRADADIASVTDICAPFGEGALARSFDGQYRTFLAQLSNEVFPLLEESESTKNRFSDALIIAGIERHLDEVHLMISRAIINGGTPDFSFAGTTSYDTTAKDFSRIRSLARVDTGNLARIVTPAERIWLDAFSESYTRYLDEIEHGLLPLLTAGTRDAGAISALHGQVDTLYRAVKNPLEQLLLSLQWDGFKATQNAITLRSAERSLAAQRQQVVGTLQQIDAALQERHAQTLRSLVATRQSASFASAVVSVAGSALILLISLLVIRSITRPLGRLVRLSYGVARGDFSQEIRVDRPREVAVLGDAFRAMQTSIQNVLSETHGLIAAVQEGRLDVRGRSDAFTGGWRDLVDGVNRLTDAFAAVASQLQEANRSLETRVEARTRELREKDEQLLQGQKMEAIGRLAGGVAHDFNNLLTVIVGYADLLLSSPAAGRPYAEEIVEIRNAARRAKSLTDALLAFSRKQILQPRLMSINQRVRGMESMLRRLIGENINLQISLADDLGAVRADPGQIDQVIMNVAVNARDAMPDGGALVIETANRALDGAFLPPGSAGATIHGELLAGDYVVLSLRDTGAGMDAETRTRLFEPFFTTKGRGKGTGLGLAIVYGIIMQSDGFIRVESTVGAGTQIEIFLPRARGSAEAEAFAVPQSHAGGGTVLLVEDEDMVRTFVARVLDAAGYQVISARNGKEALSQMALHPGRIDLLVTDVVMPEMGGIALGSRMKEILPDIRVMYMSGYTEEPALARGGGEIDLLRKPFSSAELLAKVAEVLGRYSSGTLEISS